MTETIGPQRVNDARGWLVFDGVPDDLRRAEDATLGGDPERIAGELFGVSFARPATNAERQLLGHLGYTVPDILLTRVTWLSNGLRNRRWPRLEGTGL
jgi:hypothetical protein